MKTQIFKGKKRIDGDFESDLNKSISIKIALEKIGKDLINYDTFKGIPTVVDKFIEKHKWGYECNFRINNKSGTYEDMDYEVIVSNNEIFEYIINELKLDIISARSSNGYIV